ncbi:MAG: S8 family serine peptidase, partial [Planctomycetota bacterium]
GCVSAVINNGFGVAGVAPDCRVRSAKFNTSAIDTPCPGTYATFLFAWMVEALDWAVDIGAAVTNNSNGFAVSAAITDQYTFTRALGLTHFAAAGNSSVNMLSYPSSIDAVNAVAAVDRFGSLSSFSSWGTGLAYAAPGTSILTTDRTGPDGYSNGDMTSADGTSFASPYAAGVAAMVLSMNGDLPPAIVETIMDMTSMDMGAPGYDTTFGAGLVNAHQAIIATTCSPSSGGCFEDNGSPGCDIPDCCAQVCGADPFCCNTEWDAGCAQQASETCGNCGLPGSGNCFFPGGSVTPGCEDLQCCQTICAIDPFCCETQWDGTCAAQANDLCPPPNDDCSNAVYVVGNTTYNGNLIAATPDGAATCAEPQSNPDIWYSFVAPDDGTLFASTCGTHDLPGQDDGVDTILSAHTGCPGSTSNQIACNDDNGAVCSGDLGWPRDAAIEVSVVAGQVVYLRVSHYATHVADGAIKLNIDFEAFIPNNVCSQALPITNIGATFCNEGADTDGPSPCGDLGSDIWYTYESSHTGTITVPTCASGFDTVVAVYDGCDCTPGLDRLLGCNDDFCIPLASSVTVPVVAGGCYLIQVGGFDGAQGCGVIPNIVIDVINDDCNAALPTGAGETPFSTAGSSTDGPQPCGLQLGADVWFDYTATTTGTVTIDTCDAGHDTILAAYAGCDCPVGLDDLVACNDNGCGPQQSIISFPVVAGECFKIQIGGGFSQSGSGTLTIEEDSACPAATDGSGVVDVADLVNVILAWGNDDAGADVNGDGIVDVLDLVEVIVSWGAC